MPKLTKEQVNFIKDNVNIKTNREMAEILGCNRSTISNWRKKLNISFSELHDFSEYHDYIISNYNKRTAKSLAEEIGCSQSYVTKQWRNSPLCQGKPTYRYYCDYDYFKTINGGNKAYILGLISADGCIYRRKNHQGLIQISLQISDKQILEDIKKELKSTHPLNVSRKMITLSITSDIMFNDLVKVGITEKKTWQSNFNQIFNNIPQHYWKDFIRGYFDGDGSIYLPKKGISRAGIKIAIPKRSGNVFNTYLSQIMPTLAFYEDGNTEKYNMPFGSLEAKNTISKYCFLKTIYQNHDLCLQRKYKKAQELIFRIENNTTNRSENKIAVLKWEELREA